MKELFKEYAAETLFDIAEKVLENSIESHIWTVKISFEKNAISDFAAW